LHLTLAVPIGLRMHRPSAQSVVPAGALPGRRAADHPGGPLAVTNGPLAVAEDRVHGLRPEQLHLRRAPMQRDDRPAGRMTLLPIV
jgi:hypothetical protein